MSHNLQNLKHTTLMIKYINTTGCISLEFSWYVLSKFKKHPQENNLQLGISEKQPKRPVVHWLGRPSLDRRAAGLSPGGMTGVPIAGICWPP